MSKSHSSPMRFTARNLPLKVYTDVQLLNSLFQKAYGRGIYCVTAHKLILNVSKIRLRLICARASYLYRLFQKAYGNYTVCAATENPQRIRTDKDGDGSSQ